MLPSGDCPSEVDIDNPAETEPVYNRWLTEYTEAYRDSLYVQASDELDSHLQSDYGTASYLAVLGMWALDPTDSLLVNGDWGYAHAGLAISELDAMKSAGSSNAEMEARGNELIWHYYVREAQARCRGAGGSPEVAEWLNPAEWYEDSRLDYYTPLLFIQWYISNL